MVVGTAGIGVVVRGGELRVGDQVILREAPKRGRDRRPDGGLAVGHAIAAIAENSAAQVGNRLSTQEARSRTAARVRVNECGNVLIIALRKLRGEPATEVKRTGLDYAGAVGRSNCGV